MMKVIQLQNELNLQDVVKSTVDQYNKQMSLLTDDLISEAEKNSNTMNEYIAFMKGAAFFFRRMAKRSGNQYGTPTSINTIEGAIKHCIKLLPFMEESEKIEHLMLIDWLNELLEFKGKPKIKIPSQYQGDKEMMESIKEYEVQQSNNKNIGYYNFDKWFK